MVEHVLKILILTWSNFASNIVFFLVKIEGANLLLPFSIIHLDTLCNE